MEDSTTPIAIQDNEIDDEEIVLPDRADAMKIINNPYVAEDVSTINRAPRYDFYQ